MVKLVVVSPRRNIHWRILRAIVEAEGVTNAELMQKFNITISSAASEVRSLYKLGYVRTVGVGKHHYYPTEKALRKFGRI